MIILSHKSNGHSRFQRKATSSNVKRSMFSPLEMVASDIARLLKVGTVSLIIK
jgi:hypothetical protein